MSNYKGQYLPFSLEIGPTDLTILRNGWTNHGTRAIVYKAVVAGETVGGFPGQNPRVHPQQVVAIKELRLDLNGLDDNGQQEVLQKIFDVRPWPFRTLGWDC